MRAAEVLVKVMAAAINLSDVKNVLERCLRPNRLESLGAILPVA